MNEKRYVVPEAMVEAAYSAVVGDDNRSCTVMLEAAFRWLAENPIVPTTEQIKTQWESITNSRSSYPYWEEMSKVFGILQSRMFLAPEPEIPEALQPMWANNPEATITYRATDHNATILEAYRLGLLSKEKP